MFHFIIGSSTGNGGELTVSTIKKWVKIQLFIRVVFTVSWGLVYILRYYFLHKHPNDELVKLVVQDSGKISIVACTFTVASLMCLHHLRHKLAADDESTWTRNEAKKKPKDYYNLYSFASYNPVFYWPAVGGHGR